MNLHLLPTLRLLIEETEVKFRSQWIRDHLESDVKVILRRTRGQLVLGCAVPG
jgi:hypothetical protein